jgi:hypothetical protein
MSIHNTPEKELAEIDRSSRTITQRDAVAIIATLDTKGDEVRYVSAALAAHGRSIVVFDIRLYSLNQPGNKSTDQATSPISVL